MIVPKNVDVPICAVVLQSRFDGVEVPEREILTASNKHPFATDVGDRWLTWRELAEEKR